MHHGLATSQLCSPPFFTAKVIERISYTMKLTALRLVKNDN